MARNLAARPQKWFQWASGLLLIAASCIQPVVTSAATPPIPSGQGRIWFYQGYEPPVGYSPESIPTIVANGTSVGTAPAGTVFYRDVPPGHYDVTIPNSGDVKYQSAHFDLAAGQQAYIKIILNRSNINGIRWPPLSGFGALLIPQQVAQAELPSLAAEDGRR